MAEWFTKIFDIFKLPRKFIAVLCFTSGFVSLAPVSWLKYLKLDVLKSEYGLFAAIIFLLTISLLVLEAIIWIFQSIFAKYKFRKNTESILAELKSLDLKEISVLREFFIQGQSTLQLPVNHPLVASLIEKGILLQVGNLGENSSIGPLLSLKISDIVKPNITNELIQLPRGEPTQDQINWVKQNRPEFMGELHRRKELYYGF